MITLYAITDHPTPPVPDDTGARVIADGDLAVLCGEAQTREMTAEALWEHERLVEAFMHDRDLLPVRYGTCVPDEAAVAQALQDNREAYAAALQTVRGAVELAVRVFAGEAQTPPVASQTPSPSPSPSSGTDYLRARSRSAAAEADASACIHEPLAKIARATTVARVPRAGELLRAAYLVPRDRVAAFSERVGELGERSPQLRIICTGPWPPYSFAGS